MKTATFCAALSAVVVLFASGCTTTAGPRALQIADSRLTGACRNLFLDGRMYQYQYMADGIITQSVFALADDNGTQSCGFATNAAWDVKESPFELRADWEKLEAVAIARCEAAKPPSLRAPCKPFAHGNKVIWNDNRKVDME